MAEELPHLSPRFEGERFKNHSIPVELLADLAAYRDLVRAVAKSLFKRAHPERKRVPKGFDAAFKLSLREVAEGSAVAELVNDVAEDSEEMAEILEFAEYFQDGKNLVDETIRSVQVGAESPVTAFPIPAEFPIELLPEFGKIGKHLKPGERIDFGFGGTRPAFYSDSVRQTLVLWSSEEVDADVDIVGRVVGVQSTQDDKFDLRLDDGKTIAAPLPSPHEDAILLAFKRRATHGLRAKGSGVYNRQKRLLRLSEVRDVDVLDEEDMKVVAACQRIDEMRGLPADWCGAGSTPPSSATTDAAKALIRSLVEDHELPTPFVFPTPRGEVQLEWSVNGGNVDVRVIDKVASISAYVGTGEVEESRAISTPQEIAGVADILRPIFTPNTDR